MALWAPQSASHQCTLPPNGCPWDPNESSRNSNSPTGPHKPPGYVVRTPRIDLNVANYLAETAEFGPVGPVRQ